MKASIATHDGKTLWMDSNDTADREQRDKLRMGIESTDLYSECNLTTTQITDLINLLELAQGQIRYRLGQTRRGGGRQ